MISYDNRRFKTNTIIDEHVKLNARMVPFGGWEMPVQYEGILNEHKTTREGVSLFDISHMGEFIIEGHFAKSGLDQIVTQSLDDLPIHSARYGAILNEQGGILDDLIVFRLAEEKWFLVVNGATTDKDAAHIQKHLTADAQFQDVSLQTGKLDIQGPQSRDILKTLAPGIEKLDYYTFDFFDLLGENVLISRTGYTGELGYEIYFPWNRTTDLWQELLRCKGVTPAGLGARDILRLEVGYSLYGHELNENITPLECGLTRFVDWDKDFIGKEALLQQKDQGLERKLVGFTSSSRRSPRADQKLFSDSQQDIGIVTSGTFSPILGVGIGLGFVPTSIPTKGETIYFGNEKNPVEAKTSTKFFYKNGSLKN